jgi:hypothetical protein
MLLVFEIKIIKLFLFIFIIKIIINNINNGKKAMGDTKVLKNGIGKFV